MQAEYELLKGYKLEERIGTGCFGAVYRARQTTIDREVAIKIIPPDFANNPDFIRRFEIEAHTIARLEHPYITPLIDYWRDPEGAYLVMRYLRGGSIRQALERGAYDPSIVSRILDQIGSALDFAHRNNVIHRDIKPGNILLDEDGNAYLADFGIAKDLSVISDELVVDAVVGSLDYISPEQARSEPITSLTDIYSLGVTLYEMLTGDHPFKQVSSIERLYKHINEPLPAITTLPDDICHPLNEVIQKATAKDPAKRYPEALMLASAFRQALGKDNSQVTNIVEQLTLREQEILRMIIQGQSNNEIALELVVTLSTVKWHIRQIYNKLGVRSRVQAIVRARELNLIVINKDESDSLNIHSRNNVTSSSVPELKNPYKGLRAFHEVDVLDFFGRDEMTQKLIDQMRSNNPLYRFLVVIGPSGSGKSSLVRAGLIPALWRDALPGSGKWYVVDMIPGAYPLDKLETALIRIAAHPTNTLREQLQRDDRGLLRAADIVLPDQNTELLVVIDQFEEVFTLVQSEAERQHFLNLIRTAVSDTRSRVRIILTLRADYYDRPLHYPEFGELIHNRMETVLPLSAKGLERAIRGPAERVGVSFEQGLVEQIISTMNYQSGALPLLQYALTELFDRREGRMITNETYHAIGGAVGALAHRADEIYLSLTPEGQGLTKQMFMRLVTLGEGVEDTRRRTLQPEILSLTDNTDLMEEIIDQFAVYRLLSLDHDPRTRKPTVEVAHEAILREWERLRGWINGVRAELRLQYQLASLVADWRKANKEDSYLLRGARLEQFEDWAGSTSITLTPDEKAYLQASMTTRTREQTEEKIRQARETQLEKHVARFLWIAVGVFALATVVASGLALFAFDRQAQAEAARIDAQTERDRAQELALVNGARAAFASGDADTALALAVAANQAANPSAQAQTVLSEVAYVPGVADVTSFGYWIHADISPDGQSALLGHYAGFVARWDRVNDTMTPMLPEKPHIAFVSDVGFSPDGLTGFSSSYREIMIWDVMTGERLQMLNASVFTGDSGIVADYTPDGAYLLSSNGGDPALGETADLILWDLATGEPVRNFAGHRTAVSEIAISPDGTTALSGGQYEELILWDMATGEIIRQREELNEIIYRDAPDIVYRPDGKTAIVAYQDVTAVLVDLETFETLQTYGERSEGTSWFSEMALSPDGKRVYLLAENTIYHVESGRPLVQLPINGTTFGAGFMPDGESIVVTSPNDVRLYATRYGVEIVSIPQELWWFEQSPDGARIAAYWGVPPRLNPCTLILLDATTGAPIRTFGIDDAPFDTIGCPAGVGHPWRWFAFSPDGQTMLGGVADGLVVLWDLETGAILKRFEGHVAQIHDVVFSMDGTTAITGARMCDVAETCTSSEIIHWNLATGQEIRRLIAPDVTGAFTALEISPDGTKVLSSHDAAVIFYWDLTTGEIIRRIDWQGIARDVTFSPDGTTALIAGVGATPSALVDLATGAIIHSLNAGVTTGIVFTPDGQYAITAGVRLSVWDLSTGEEIRRYAENKFFIAPTVRSDGTFMVYDVEASAIRHLRIDSIDELLAWTWANRYIRELTCTERATYRIDPECDQ